jgi:hypothetical protein
MITKNKISLNLQLSIRLVIVWFVVKIETRLPWLRNSSVQAGEKPPHVASIAMLNHCRLGFCLEPWMRILLSPYYLY